ncbi:MAG: GlsB/YeaQ/YmgE family stress response membrane protein [Micavibrio aeruginosavorus]|uniref:GlsB/YeaQ/YmgE family stress response membrane protein n=1 Tax=Micavibrio aeruginosavorus TaxID=349221 RepID=A0A2W5A4C6_9BACT|nr:MAG: GlsB/YeaQ/YmgE family stress response membrane protein [Micavibrio aeruginosavorus]
MEEQQVGWLGALIVGCFAGWLAEKAMKSDQGLFTNIVLGVIGAIIGNAIFAAFDIVLAGWVGYLIAGFIGACGLIAVSRLFGKKKL